MLAVAVFAFFHLSLATFMNVGNFPIFCLAAWTVFLLGWFWDVLLPRLRGRPPRPESDAPAWRIGRPVQIAAALVLLYVVGHLALRLAPFGFGNGWPEPVAWIGRVLRVNQAWTMFAPGPPRVDLWLVVEGRLADGGRVDRFRRAPVHWDKPASVPATHRGFRWRLWLLTSSKARPDARRAELHRRFGEYLCREWNDAHPPAERLESLRVVVMSERTQATHVEPPVRLVGYERPCPAPAAAHLVPASGASSSADRS